MGRRSADLCHELLCAGGASVSGMRTTERRTSSHQTTQDSENMIEEAGLVGGSAH